MNRLLTNRFFHTIILVVMLFTALFIRTQDYDWTSALRFLAFDYYNNLKPRPPTDQVVIVDIDETSFSREELGQWPWSRDMVGKMVENLHAMGARAIVFDMVFPEADRTSPKAIISRHAAEERKALQELVNNLPDNDQIFAQIIKESGNVVTAFIWSSQSEATRRNPVISRPILMARNLKPLYDTVAQMRGVVTNIPELSKAAAGNGSFGVQPDVDGIIRRVPLLFSFNDEKRNAKIMYPSLALEAIRVAHDPRTMIRIRKLPQEEMGLFTPPLMMSVGEYDIPLDWSGDFFVHFSKHRFDEYIPAWQVIENQIDAGKVKDKIVFIGTSAEGLKDIRSTPLNLFIPGVEVHVNVVEQIIQSEYLYRPKLIEGAEFLAILIAGTIIIFVSPFVGAVFMAFFTMFLAGFIFVTSWYAFDGHGLLLDPAFPSLSIIVLFMVSSLFSYIRTEAERKQVRDAFGLYISPDFMKELTKNPDRLKLGGEMRDLSVLFSDIRSFTSISENLTPEELIQLMNDFLTPMSDLVMENRGTIDKYMGDAMMAFWNAPLDDKDHARNACITALKMNKALDPINEMLAKKAESEGTKPLVLEAGIGINTGRASVGNMGSRQRFAYSALGDTVNLASRLEGQTKQYGVRILIGEETRQQAPEFAALELDLIQVKGKLKPERIFVLLGNEEMAQSDYFKKWKIMHDEMLESYRAMNWEKAIERAKSCHEHCREGMKTFYEIFIARIQDLQENPPPQGWDGVYIAKSK